MEFFHVFLECSEMYADPSFSKNVAKQNSWSKIFKALKSQKHKTEILLKENF